MQDEVGGQGTLIHTSSSNKRRSVNDAHCMRTISEFVCHVDGSPQCGLGCNTRRRQKQWQM
jgi:hypothetical protein